MLFIRSIGCCQSRDFHYGRKEAPRGCRYCSAGLGERVVFVGVRGVIRLCVHACPLGCVSAPLRFLGGLPILFALFLGVLVTLLLRIWVCMGRVLRQLHPLILKDCIICVHFVFNLVHCFLFRNPLPVRMRSSPMPVCRSRWMLMIRTMRLSMNLKWSQMIRRAARCAVYLEHISKFR